MEDFLVAEILEQLYSRLFSKISTRNIQCFIEVHMIIILEPSVQDDRSTTFNGAFLEYGNEPHLCRQKMIFNLSGHLTCLTVPVYVARFTRALVASSYILTSSTVLTRGLSTFIDI